MQSSTQNENSSSHMVEESKYSYQESVIFISKLSEILMIREKSSLLKNLNKASSKFKIGLIEKKNSYKNEEPDDVDD